MGKHTRSEKLKGIVQPRAAGAGGPRLQIHNPRPPLLNPHDKPPSAAYHGIELPPSLRCGLRPHWHAGLHQASSKWQLRLFEVKIMPTVLRLDHTGCSSMLETGMNLLTCISNERIRWPHFGSSQCDSTTAEDSTVMRSTSSQACGAKQRQFVEGME